MWALNMQTMETRDPTNPFTMLEPQDQEIGEFYVLQERRATDFEASKLWKGSSGSVERLQKSSSEKSIVS